MNKKIKRYLVNALITIGMGIIMNLHVTVKGTPHVDTGYCMDMKELSDIIKEFVEEPLDHKNLNLDVPWMHGKLASTENLVIEIWNQLIDPVSKHRLCTSCY